MGVSITANNSNFVFHCSCTGLYRLRANIAKAYDEQLGELYKELFSVSDTADNIQRVETEINNLLSDEQRFKKEDYDILDFLFGSETFGRISYKTCKKIYELIKDINFGNKIFTYAAHSSGNDYELFKQFLSECYSKKRNMIWN